VPEESDPALTDGSRKENAMADLKTLLEAVVEMDESTALELTRKFLEEGVDAGQVFETYQSALAEVGRRFEKNEYFIPELIMSSEIMKAASELIKPKLAAGGADAGPKVGKLLIATVEGDIHDIGKDIAAMLFELNGFDVKDLGVDVSTDRIVSEARSWGADIVGLSGLLTLAFDPMKTAVDKLEGAGLRNKVKVIIGGGQMDEQVRLYTRADAFVTDAVTGVKICKEWLQ
jgi:methanogenic corrinoid protein MtbC1